MQEALRTRLQELAATHVRYGYWRLTVLLRREGWQVNVKHRSAPRLAVHRNFPAQVMHDAVDRR